MLWLCLSLPELSLELQQPSEAGPLAITDRQGARRLLLVCNRPARQAGIHPGMDITTALVRAPGLRLVERSRTREKRALQALAGWAEQFSGWVCFDTERWLLWLEIGASLRYFGGLDMLLEKVGAGIEALGYRASRGVAPTPEAAALLARQRQAAPLAQLDKLLQVIASLPIDTLALAPVTIESLQASGIKLIGELLRLPHDALARRWGVELTDYLKQLLGERPDPRQPYRTPQKYRRRFDFMEPIETVEALLFPLRRLLQELQGYLRGRDTAIQALQITFLHRDHAPTTFELRTTEPQREAVRLFALLRERLERIELPAATREIRMAADHFVSPGDTQLRLFDATQRQDAGWSELLDKLRARLGDRAICQLGLRDDHLPEQAWCVASGAPEAAPPGGFPERPLWLLEPQLIHQLPKLLGKPERIEAGWWTGEDLSRDYYIAQTDEGSRWWLFREAQTSQWFLQGIWA